MKALGSLLYLDYTPEFYHCDIDVDHGVTTTNLVLPIVKKKSETDQKLLVSYPVLCSVSDRMGKIRK